MLTVESIIQSVYGRPVKAAAKLGVKPSAVSNWKASGYFPSRLIKSLCQDAKSAGVDLDMNDIPVADIARSDA